MKIKRRTFTQWLLALFALPAIPAIAVKYKDPSPLLTRLSNAVNKDYDTSPVEPAYIIKTDGPEWISWEEYQRTHKGSGRGCLDTVRFIENHRIP